MAQASSSAPGTRSFTVVPLLFPSQSLLPKKLHIGKFGGAFPSLSRGSEVLPPSQETNEKAPNPKSLKARQAKFQSAKQKEEQARMQRLLASLPNSGGPKWKLTDNKKKVYEGTPEAPEAESHLFVFAVPADSTTIYAAPVDVLRFRPQLSYATLSLDEAEAQMKAGTKVPRFLKSQELKELVEDSKKPVVEEDDDGLELGGEDDFTSGVQTAKPKKKAKKPRAGKEDGDEDNDDEPDDGGDAPADGEDGDPADGYAGPSEGASASVLDEEVEAEEPDTKAEGLDYKENFDDDEEVVNEDAAQPSTAAVEEGLESDDEGGAPKMKNQKLSKQGKRIEDLLSDKKTVQPMVTSANKGDSDDEDDDADDDDDDEVSDVEFSEEDEDAEDDDDDDEAVGSKRKKPSDKERPSSKKQKTAPIVTAQAIIKVLKENKDLTLKALAELLQSNGFDTKSEAGKKVFIEILKKEANLVVSGDDKVVQLKQRK